MTLDRFLHFYQICNGLGFVKLNKNDNIISIYAPIKENVEVNVKYVNHAVFNCQDDELDFYKTIGSTCWITQKRSAKVLKKITNIRRAMLKKYKVNIDYHIYFKGCKCVLLETCHDDIVIKRYKIKLFSLNNAKRA